MSSSKAAKAAKNIILTAQAVGDHNSVKLKSIIKWLKLGHEVRVQIKGQPDRHKAMDSIYEQIETDLKSGAKFTQKIVSPSTINFVLKPNKDSLNLIEDSKEETINVEEEISSLAAEQDVFSEDFEKQLTESIKSEKFRNKRK